MKKIQFIAILLCSIIGKLSAQGNQAVKGIWFTPKALQEQSFDWKAQWIWLKEKHTSDMLLARRSFELSEEESKPSLKALLRITASTHYKLYLNGQYIAQGPARSAPHHQSFDIWEVEKLLQVGKNTIAVRVHHQRGKYSYHFDGRAGLLVQLDLKLSSQTDRSITSDDSWRVSPDPSWSNEAPKINRFQLVVGDSVDLRKSISGWNEVEFDDSTWGQASPLFRKVGWPSVQKNAQAHALTPPWTALIPRDIPYILEAKKNGFNLIGAYSIPNNVLNAQSPIDVKGENYPSLLQVLDSFNRSDKSLQIPSAPAAFSQVLLFDLGSLHNGTPQLEIEGAAGTQVEVRCAPFIVDSQFTHKVVFSNFRDQLILSGGIDRWEATYWKPTRFLALVIEGSRAIKLHKLGIRSISYPFEQKGKMHSNDAPWVKAYMDATAKTIEACTTDGYTDNYRERRQYAQTGYYGAMGNYWIFGDSQLQRRYLVQVAQEQEANGMMPAYAPLASDDFMIILDSNCLWVRSLREYFLHTGDEVTTRELLPAAQKLMTLLHSFTNELGLIDNPPYPYWLDHAVIDRRGANLTLNGHYLGALEDFAEVLDWLEESGSETFSQRADLLRQSIRQHFWNPDKGLFVDALIEGELSPQSGEHANAMTLAMNIATSEQAQAVAHKLLEADTLNYVKRASGMIMVTPAMSYFLHKGLCQYGYIDESLALFRRRFDKMLEPSSNQTLFEEWWLDKTGRSGRVRPHSRSDAQTESCFPSALFGEFLLGVRPIEPGMKKVEIYHPDTELKHVEGFVPSPLGPLFVKWQISSDRELVLTVPGGMEVVLNLASLKLKEIIAIQVNGKTIAVDTEKEAFLSLEAGEHIIQF